MRTYKFLNSEETITLIKNEVVKKKAARVDDDALKDAVDYVCKAVTMINALDEYTHTINMVDVDKLMVPKAFRWMIQPKSVRIVATKKCQNLRNNYGFFTGKEFLPVTKSEGEDTPEKGESETSTSNGQADDFAFSATEWENSWEMILSAYRLSGKAEVLELVEKYRTDKTYDDTVLNQLIINDSKIAPGLTEDQDFIAVTFNPFKTNLVVNGFDDNLIRLKIQKTINEMKA